MSKIAETEALGRSDRLAALARFLSEFPTDNPLLETAQQYVALLKAGKEPRAALGDMVEVPAGPFFMGCRGRLEVECDDAEKPGKTVTVGAFSIDKTEVTAAAFKRCVDARACSSSGLDMPYWSDQPQPDWAWACTWGKAGQSEHPINCVDWSQAEAFCRWAGKRLPTEAEWEKAARGTDGWEYPWGNSCYGSTSSPVANIADATAKKKFSGWPTAEGYTDGYEATAPVGRFPAGQSPYGALDMMGNVWEWVSYWYTEDKYRLLRGGSWRDRPSNARASYRVWRDPAARFPFIGFRCARSH